VTVLDEVVRAFFAAEIPRQAARLTELIELVLPSGDDLVDVALMAGVPQDRVGRRFEDAMKRERQLDCAEIGPEMPTGFGDCLDDEVTDLPG
jgi:hypothetical protein